MSNEYQPAGPGRRRTLPVLTKHVPVRFPPDLIAKVKELANEDRRTVSSWIRNLVEREIRRRTDEIDITTTDFAAMWDQGQPVETVTVRDWVDDPNMSAEETIQRFDALGPEVAVGPDENQRKRLIQRVADAIWLHGFRSTGTASSGVDISESSVAAAIVDHLNRPAAQQAAS